jgi:hypothetical protein
VPRLFSFPNLCGEEKDINQKVPGADSNLGSWNLALAKSRVHAACCESKGQPFYGWFVDGSNDKTQARF